MLSAIGLPNKNISLSLSLHKQILGEEEGERAV